MSTYGMSVSSLKNIVGIENSKLLGIYNIIVLVNIWTELLPFKQKNCFVSLQKGAILSFLNMLLVTSDCVHLA